MVRFRIGALVQKVALKDVIDLWWRVTRSTPLDEIYGEIDSLIATKGMEFFDRASGLRGICNELELISRQERRDFLTKIYLAICKFELGDIEGARVGLEFLLGPDGGWKNRAEEVASTLGLKIASQLN
jgi:hypothetical protein